MAIGKALKYVDELDKYRNQLNEMLLSMRASLLQQVDGIEIFLGMERTADIRKRDRTYMMMTDKNTDYTIDKFDKQ